MRFVDNTFLDSPKVDKRDRIEVEIGDSKQPDFKPQFKIMRWDNEVNFSIRAEEEAGATVIEEDGRIKYKAQDYEVHQYEKPVDEDGGFEFEWLLKKKPKTNILTTTLQTKGLDFLFQPGLTALWRVGDNHEGRTVATVTDTEVVDTDGNRIAGKPKGEAAVNSYAVYHKSRGGLNNADGKEYKAGKAFHIYRPKAVDANSKEIWCDIDITEEELKVTIDQAWLDGAKYPVTVDPTFGFTSIGADFTNSSFIRMSLFTLSEAANITSMSYYIDEGSSNQDTSSGIYDDDATGSEAGTLIANSGATAGTTGPDWRTSTLVHNGLAAANWWLGHWQQSARDVYHDNSGGPGGSVGGSFNTWPDPAGTLDTNNDYKYSVYATYTAAGGATAVKDIIGVGIVPFAR
jgi:hypothetical protein